jgi:hypothetical protein
MSTSSFPPERAAIPFDRAKRFLVLSSQRAFESLAGPVPEAVRSRYVFLKPGRVARIHAALAGARLVISQSYPRPELNRWIFEARRRGIPTLLLVDGPLEWANIFANPSLARAGAEAARALFEPIVHDAVATIGEAQSRFIASRNPGRGITFMSYANHRIRTITPSDARAGSPTGRPIDPATPSFDFLLTTARTPAFDEHERASLIRALVACAGALNSTGHRTQMRIFDDEIRQAVQRAVPSAHFDATGSFTDALAQSRCVIGTPSSVLLESMLHDRPTAILVFRDGPLLYQTGWLLGGFSDWSASFSSMLARDPDRMAQQHESLRENVSDDDFFAQIEALVLGDRLAAPRPLDALDLEFENRVLRQLVGFRARLFGPIYRALRSARSKRSSSS